MSEEKIEEETYSLIFKSLKHPIRRKILRVLVNKQLAFSEILNILSIDSGHLSYHIENLGDLVKHSANGKYELSSIGIAAVNLMSGVEERPRPLTSIGKLRRKTGEKMISKRILLVTVCLVLLTIVAGAYGYILHVEVLLKELERENSLLESRIAILRACPFDGYTVMHVGEGNNLSVQVVDLMEDYGAQIILLTDTLRHMGLNDLLITIFDTEWIEQNIDNPRFHDFLRDAAPKGVQLVAIGENTSQLIEALYRSGVVEFPSYENGTIRNPAYFNPPLVGLKIEKIEMDGVAYSGGRFLVSNTDNVDSLVQALIDWQDPPTE